MLDTVELGFAECERRWRELLASPVDSPPGNATRFFDLFRVLLLEPDGDVAAATQEFLSADPDRDALTDLLLYLDELSAVSGEAADRARQCRQLVEEQPGLA
jgi:hypothetical protein